MNELEIINAKIQFLIPSLSKGEKNAALYLMQHLDDIPELSLSLIAEEAGVSQATIVRLCKKIGYKGFLEIRNNIRASKHKKTALPPCDESSGQEDIKRIMDEVINGNIEIMKNAYALISEEYIQAVDAIMKARVVSMFGNGDAIIPCELMSIKLMKIGIPCQVINDQDMQLFSASSMGKEDVAIAVSHTGRSASVVEAMKKAQERGAVTIGITGAAKSPLIRYCSVALHTGAIHDVTGGDVIARRIGEQTIMETLYLEIMSRIETSVKDKKMEGVENINRIYKISDLDSEEWIL